MRVHPSQLEAGNIIVKDVWGYTNYPIISKNTVVKPIHITILHKFLIDEVEISHRFADGETIKNIETLEEESPATEQVYETSFIHHYLETVQKYKLMFRQWQAGSPVDVVKVRQLIVPLINEAQQNRLEILKMHRFSTKEDYLYHHSVAVGLLAALIARQLKYSKGEVIQIGLAGVLSDCGMAKIDPHILHKMKPLTTNEFEDIKKHPTYSYRMIENSKVLKHAVLLGVLQHHERIDGSGYPIGLRANKIHTYGKIIAVCDTYHAMTSERLYRSKQSPFKVIEAITHDQFGKFDHRIVKALMDSFLSSMTGTRIKLNDNTVGEIIFTEAKHPTRPMIRLQHTDEIIHLQHHPHLHIQEVL
ncbi:HD-GYP domain-containing protein [Pontibacillus litoralis]|uniref:Phosphohydrolase n=1 Tax=Pontibacillus litoralis JSM 072002 TaxID=1385512 RepID=A0A0A5FXX4_9BACI|nr:HD-GYP domain-containing protein [Pontibacillus litoralis]KGX85671.1 phosphohydrolase [Pontibacillus litoralis JSM 072002]